MKKIEISTSHNIMIEFTLANLMARIMATLIDLFLIYLYILLIFLVFDFTYEIIFIFIFPVFTFYHLAFEILNDGQSPGKMALKIRVISTKGTSPSIYNLFTRWLFRMVDITMSLGCMAIFYISANKYNQRLGDMLAQTAVVMSKEQQPITLRSLDKLQEIKREFKYPGLTRYNDTDMLLVKDALTRLKNHKEEVNKKFVGNMASRIREELNIDRIQDQSSSKFLKQILEEYILMTR